MSLARALLALSGAAAAGAAALYGSRRSQQTEAATMAAVAQGGTFQARLTGYWPFSALSEAERKMEGGVHDRKGKPLYTLEDAQAGRAPYVSVSGDDAIFPYGQRIEISTWPGVVFRVVDTGGHFRGAGKVYRATGLEPLDVCVASAKTVVPKTPATVKIARGDHFDKPGAAVAVSKFEGQAVSVGDELELLDAEEVGTS